MPKTKNNFGMSSSQAGWTNMLLGTKNSKMRPEYQQQNIDKSKAEVTDVPEGCIEQIYDDLKYCGYI